MTKDEAETAANEATALLAALIKVTRGLGLTPEQTAAAVLDALTSIPKVPYWFAALAQLHADGIRMLQPPKEPQRRLHS
jgi:hypothetical protein